MTDLFSARPPVMTPWKPSRCTDCNAPHPTINRDGGRAGTAWRCNPCDERKRA